MSRCGATPSDDDDADDAVVGKRGLGGATSPPLPIAPLLPPGLATDAATPEPGTVGEAEGAGRRGFEGFTGAADTPTVGGAACDVGGATCEA